MNQETLVDCAKNVDDMIKNAKLNGIVYSGTRILGTKTRDNKTPALFCITTNRSDGKTSFFALFHLLLATKYERNFAYLVRNVADLKQAHLIFSDVVSYYNMDLELSSKMIVENAIYQILNKKTVIGYAVNIKKSDDIKKYSPILSTIDCLCMEEYQLKTNRYLKDETELVQSIHRSVARGQGKMSRYVPLILLGNPISLLNPYLVFFGIYRDFKKMDTIIRGLGYVADFRINPHAGQALIDNPISKLYDREALADEIGTSFKTTDACFVSAIPKKSRYLCTIYYKNHTIGVRTCPDYKLHVSLKPDPCCQIKMVFNHRDLEQNRRVMKQNSILAEKLRASFLNGNMLYQDLKCKMFIIDILGIK